MPKSIFNYILRENNGNAIIVTDDTTTNTSYSSDTWAIELLCEDCEKKLNLNYDDFGVSVFRGRIGKVNQNASGVTLSGIDKRKLRMFFLSILWRISISPHASYSNINLPDTIENALRAALYKNENIPSNYFTVTLFRICDSSPKDGFDLEGLREIILSPCAVSNGKNIKIRFIILGYFIEIILPGVPKSYLKRPGCIHGNSDIFLAPYIEVFDIPELASLFVTGRHKENIGLSKIC